MDRFDLQLALAIRDHGSMAAAALSLHIEPPAVSKRLASLELKLGQSLFQRTTRRISATAEGEALCRRAEQLLQGFADLESELLERKHEPTGPIRLAATFGFGRLWVGPAAARFQQRYPQVDIQLQLTEHLPDLALGRYDGAIWLWSPDGRQAAQCVSRRLARNQRVLVASPAYLGRQGKPAIPADLAQHSCLLVHENDLGFDVWPLQQGARSAPVRVRVKGSLSSNSGELVRDWCLKGRGIMLRSLWDIAPQLATGELHQVLPGWSMRDADIHWLAPYRPTQPRRIRLLIDDLADEFSAEPWKGKRTA